MFSQKQFFNFRRSIFLSSNLLYTLINSQFTKIYIYEFSNNEQTKKICFNRCCRRYYFYVFTMDFRFNVWLYSKQNGMHDIGILAFLCFIVSGAIAYMGDQTKNLDKNTWGIVLVAGALALISAIWFYFKISDSIMGGSLVGFGLYIAAIAAHWSYRICISFQIANRYYQRQL